MAALLEDVVVQPGHRGRGIGSALLRHLLAEARKQGALRVTLLTDTHNERAKALYAKLGFRPSSMTAMRLHWRQAAG
jgi:ribosomal protein S18 acetylase RimI-like enzyme